MRNRHRTRSVPHLTLMLAVVLGVLLGRPGAAPRASALPYEPGVEFMSATGGTLQRVVTRGSIAYVAEGAGLTILNVGNPAEPVQVARVNLPAMLTALAVGDGYAYLGAGQGTSARLFIYDLRELASPRPVGELQLNTLPRDLQVQGTLVYVIGDRGLEIVDVAERSRPVGRGRLDNFWDGQSIAVAGNLAYISAWFDGLKIVDVGNPDAPTLIRTYKPEGDHQFHDLVVQGGRAYLAASNTGMLILDLGDPTSPRLLGTFAGSDLYVYDLALHNSLLYMSTSWNSVRVIDVANPTAPVELGRYSVPDVNFGDLALVGSLVLAIDPSNQLSLIDMSTPTSPALRGSYRGAGKVVGIELRDQLAYVLNERGMAVLDLLDLAHPRLRGSYEAPGAQGQGIVEGLAYICTGQRLEIVDVSNPDQPRRAGLVEGACLDVSVSGSVAYVAAGDRGLLIYDVSNPASPRQLAQLTDYPRQFDSVTIAGSRAYVNGTTVSGRYSWGRLYVVDVAVPSQPVLRGSYEQTGYRAGVVPDGDHVYAAGRGHLAVLDGRNPDHLALVGRHEQTSVRDIERYGAHVYASGDSGGTHIYDVSDPAAPALVQRIPALDLEHEIEVANSHFFSASEDAGLVIMRVNPGAYPPPERCFPETHQCISGRFREYWEQNGGLAVFGYPITPTREERNRDTGQTYLTQWFERNRFELHPEHDPPYDVLLGRLGDDALVGQGIDWTTLPRAAGPQQGCRWFAETQHNVCNQAAGLGFLRYWERHGLEFDGQPGFSYAESLALFGLPLSEPAMETNGSGDTVLTQWFERARFEWHPDKPDQYKVLLGLLGNEQWEQSSSFLIPG